MCDKIPGLLGIAILGWDGGNGDDTLTRGGSKWAQVSFLSLQSTHSILQECLNFSPTDRYYPSTVHVTDSDSLSS